MKKEHFFSIFIMTGCLIVFSLFFSGLSAAPFSAKTAHAADISIVVDGQAVSSDVPPTIVEGRTLVPVRAVSETLEAQVAWNESLRTVTIARGSMVMSLQADKSEYIMNGMIKSLDVPVKILNGRTMVPLRVIGEAFGADVNWNDASRTVTITNNGAPIAVQPEQENVQLQTGVIRITKNKVNIRRGPGTTYEIATQVDSGTTFDLTGVSGDWFQLRMPDGSIAYVANWLAEVYDPSVNQVLPSTPTEPPLEPEPEPQPEPAPAPEVQAPEEPADPVHNQPFISLYNKVNLRSGPGTNYDIVGQISRGTELIGIAQQGDWYQMNYNGQRVWVSMPLVSAGVAGGKGGNVDPAPDTNASTKMMSVLEVKSEPGQSWVTFDVADAKVEVLDNTKETIVVQINGVQVPADFGNPVSGVHPFNGMTVENSGSQAVKITTSATNNGYFRLDRRSNKFSIMAVAKHKNGQLGLAGKTIVLDPGHGNYGAGGQIDPGAISKHNGLSEVDFNTPLSMKLKDKLEAAGATVIMTRGAAPVHISLADRANLANDNAADAFISIHGDSATNTSAYGAGTWLYTGDLRLTSAAQKDMRNEFARSINTGIANATGRPAYIKYANFAVTRENEVPSVLVEAAFLSNPQDAALLATDGYQEKLAQGMFDGLAQYFSY